MQILALVLAPIAGFIMDYQVNAANLVPDPFKRRLARVQAGFWPMIFTTTTLTAVLACRFFDSPVAIYTSIIFITLLRSFLVAVASAYLRIRWVSSSCRIYQIETSLSVQSISIPWSSWLWLINVLSPLGLSSVGFGVSSLSLSLSLQVPCLTLQQTPGHHEHLWIFCNTVAISSLRLGGSSY